MNWLVVGCLYDMKDHGNKNSLVFQGCPDSECQGIALTYVHKTISHSLYITPLLSVKRCHTHEYIQFNLYDLLTLTLSQALTWPWGFKNKAIKDGSCKMELRAMPGIRGAQCCSDAGTEVGCEHPAEVARH